MNILLCNNFARSSSGIDNVVRQEQRLLRAAGHSVTLFSRDNADYDRASPARRMAIAFSAIYSPSVRREALRLLGTEKIDVIHVHNTMPLIGAAFFDACRKHPGIPIVHTLHNYRAFCISSYAYRREKPCALCSPGFSWPCAWFGCYRSRLHSACAALTRTADAVRGRPYGVDADVYIAVSEHVKQRHVQRRIPEDKIRVLPNAVPDLKQYQTPEPNIARPRLFYVGTVIPEKGAHNLIPLATRLPDFDIHIVGQGGAIPELRTAIGKAGISNVILHGYTKHTRLLEAWKDAWATLCPSLWEEPFPLVALESLSLGIPVITTGSGGLRECVDNGNGGLIADFSDPAALAQTIRSLANNRVRYAQMKARARQTYESRYTETKHLSDLLRILEEAIAAKRREITPIHR